MLLTLYVPLDCKASQQIITDDVSCGFVNIIKPTTVSQNTEVNIVKCNGNNF